MKIPLDCIIGSTMKKAWFFSLFIASLLILTGCPDPFNPGNMTFAPPAGKGSFSLALGAGRTILPDTPVLSDFAVYNLAFTPAGGGEAVNEDRTNETLAEPVILEPGTYNLVVSAYKDSEKTQLLARGALDGIVITAGQNTAAAVELEALLTGGEGTFRFDITLPSGVTASMKITPIGADGTAEQTVTLDGTAASATLVSGQYSLTFVLTGADGKKVEWKEILHVYQNLESVFTFVFIDAHLSDSAYTVTWQYNDDVTAEQTVNVLHSGKLSPNNPTRTGYVFGGWYTDAAFAGNAYDFDQPVIEPFTLYAKWEVLPGAGMADAIPLTLNTWADGYLPTSSDVQWFSFEATAATQYIHASFGTLTDLYVQVYTSAGATQGNETNLYSGSTTYISRGSLTAGNTYYIRVRPYSSTRSGTYQIAFNTTIMPPFTNTPIPLTENQWADGNIAMAGGQQWFSFTATAATQYIHAATGTMNWTNGGVYVRVYTSAGATQGAETRLYSSTANISRDSLTVGETYYIRVRPYSSSYSGTYRIAFNTSTTAPPVELPTNAIQLTLNTWADGYLPASNSQQWFVFTATAATQYIYIRTGTLTSMYMQVYNSSGGTVSTESNWTNTTTSSTRSLTVGQNYYIRVRPYDSSYAGDYRIAFTSSPIPPGVTPIPLTENQWTDGSLAQSTIALDCQQWFVFTATATTQYLHIELGTLENMYLNVYNSSNNETSGTETQFTSSSSTSQTLTPGQTYYIRVRRYNSNYSGTYRIAFNATPYPPGTTFTPLTLNTWADGNLPTSSDVQWFSFTATDATQYIHAATGATGAMNWTNGGVYVQVYTSAGAAQGTETRMYSSTANISRASLTAGDTYYIRVRPYSSSYSGTYRIGFGSIVPPGPHIPLTENQWADGDLPTSNDVQWFSFTATATAQYIHASSGTMNWTNGGVYAQVYDSAGATQGAETRMYIATASISWASLTPGDTYYIRVRPSSSSYTGTYRIAFAASIIPPGTTFIPLTENQWADGNIATAGGQQWFIFTATAGTQYIHASFGTLTDLYVYTSANATQGAETRLYSSTTYIYRGSLTAGDTYYIRVRPYSSSYSGTYRIAFNTSTAKPPVQMPSNGILSVDFEDSAWSGGSYDIRTVTSGGYQWTVSGVGNMDANDRYIGTRSVRLRGNSGDNCRIELTDYLTPGIGSVSFDYASYGTHNGGTIVLYYQVSGSANWQKIGEVTAPSWSDGGSIMLNKQFDLNIAGGVRIRIVREGDLVGSTSVNIDNIVITSFQPQSP